MSWQPLTPYALTDWQRAKDYLQRTGSADDSAVKQAVNLATAKLEELAGMPLRFRTFRDRYTVAGCSVNGTTLTGPGGAFDFTTGAVVPRAGDLVFATGMQTSPQAAVASITSGTVLELDETATANGSNLSVIFGQGRLKADGSGTSMLILPMRPVHALWSARYLDDAGAYQTLDITDARLDDAGTIRLPRDAFPAGRMNIELECSAGWPKDGGSALVYQQDWQRLEGFCLELARLYFERFKLNLGSQDMDFGGSARSTARAFEVPDHITSGMLRYAELWP